MIESNLKATGICNPMHRLHAKLDRRRANVIRFVVALAAALSFLSSLSTSSQAESYPILAYGARTFVAETTQSGRTILVRVYRRQSELTWDRYGGFTIPAEKFAARRAEVRRNPSAASSTERVYFTGKLLGWTPFRPSDPIHRPPRFRRKG
jgi:hypothetical protein